LRIFEEKGYTYLKHLSTGGEGEVHLIKSVDKDFIAKIFPRMSDDFLKLMKHLARVNVPHIPKIYEVFNYGDKTIIIRDYVEGNTLYDEINKNGSLTLKRAKDILFKVCETLTVLHQSEPNPIIYRDLKPENIIVTPSGDVMVIDFGIARFYKTDVSRDTILAGTRGYTAPEVMAGMQSDERSDVYSAGLLFYEMITGKNVLEPPYQIRPVKESDKFLPDWLDDVISKATDFNQTNRYDHISDFVYAIKAERQFKERPKQKRRLLWIITSVIAVVALVIIGILGATMLRDDESSMIEEEYPSEVSDTNDTELVMESIDTHNLGGDIALEDESYEVVLDISFTDGTYKDWMNLVGINIDYGHIHDVNIEDQVREGIYEFQYETMMKYQLSSGMIFHMRIKPHELVAYKRVMVCLLPTAQDQSEASYNIHLEYGDLLSSEIRTEHGYSFLRAEGLPLLCESEWLDLVIYFDEETNTIKYFVFNENQVAYGGVMLRPEWGKKPYDILMTIMMEDGSLEEMAEVLGEVDYIRYATGSLVGYLRDYVDGYNLHRELVDGYIQEELKLIEETEYILHGISDL